jgi:cytidyltransferase-like protein
MRQTIGIVSGAFKPFTKGHFFLVEKAASICDKVLLLVSTGDRVRKNELPIFWDGQMEVIWNKYLIKIMPKNVEVIFTDNPTSATFKIIGDANNEDTNNNSYVIFGDAEDTAKTFPEKNLLKYFPRLVANDQIEIKGFDRVSNVNISGTMMREFLVNNDIENFTAGLPIPVQRWGQEIFNILHASVTAMKTAAQETEQRKNRKKK